MKVEIITPGPSICITKDNVKVTISSSIAYRVVNPIVVKYVLGGQLNHALVEATHAGIRNIVGESLLDDLLIKRALIMINAKNIVSKTVPSGIYI